LNLYQNLQYLSYDKYISGKIHPILKVNCNSSRDVNRIPTKLKLITRTYILQCNRAKFRRGEINKICLLCGDEEETLEHFILYCPMLVSIRNPVIDDIVEALHIQSKITFGTLSVNEQLSLILDCSYLVKCHRNIERISNVEFNTRRLLHNLYSARHRMILNIKWTGVAMVESQHWFLITERYHNVRCWSSCDSDEHYTDNVL
jgi:hypothetical protein